MMMHGLANVKFGDQFLKLYKTTEFCEFLVIYKSHNCGTTGGIYENGLYLQNVFNVFTVMTGTQTQLFCRFTPQFSLTLSRHGTDIWRVSWHCILPMVPELLDIL